MDSYVRSLFLRMLDRDLAAGDRLANTQLFWVSMPPNYFNALRSMWDRGASVREIEPRRLRSRA